MAKETLKSMFGMTDRRVHVNYDPSEITLAPTVQQTRGSGTVVQAMPQTNQALKFARALNQVPQILGAAKNIGKKQAEEDFSQMTDAEKKAAMEDDKKISRWLGYDKTFQEELVKDHFVRTAGDINKRFTNLAANPAAYGSDSEFDAAITAEKQALIGELQEKFGNNPNRVMAINAFGDKIMTEVIGDTTEMYETNKINYTLDIKGAHLADKIKNNGKDGVVVGYDELFKEYLDDIRSLDGVDNKLAKANFVANVTAIAKELQSNEQFGRAADVVRQALDYEFYKGAKIAGTDRGNLATLLDGIQTKIEADVEEQQTEGYDDSVNYAVNQLTKVYGYAQHRTYESLSKVEKQVMLSGFQAIDPNFTLEELETTLKETGSIYDALQVLENKFSLSSSDMVRRKSTDVAPLLRAGRQVQSTFVRPNIVDDADKEDHINALRKLQLQDSEYDDEKYSKDNGIVNFPELREASTSINELSWFYKDVQFKEAESRFRTAIAKLDETIAGDGAKSSKAVIDSYMNANYQLFIDDIIQRVANGELTEETAWNEMKRLQDEAAERFVSAIHYENSDDLVLSQQEKNEYDLSGFGYDESTITGRRQKDADSSFFKLGIFEYDASNLLGVDVYPSIKALFGGANINTSNQVGGKTAQEVIDSDRTKMVRNFKSGKGAINMGAAKKKNQSKNALQFSLGRYGVDIMEDPDKFEEIVDMLDIAEYDAYDVRLFSSNADFDSFIEGSVALFNKRSQQITSELTDTEKEGLENLRRLGIKNTADLNSLIEAQRAFNIGLNNQIQM